MTENVVVLEPGDERAQKIAKAMGSPTANEILRLLGNGQKSLTDITNLLAIPMTTAKYHMENLLDAGLISVAETKYSVKGREVKIYSITDQLLIVAPRRSNIRSLLLKYASLFGILALATLSLVVLPVLLSGTGTGAGAPLQTADREAGVMAAKAIPAPSVPPAAAPVPEFVLAFFFGGMMVILVLLVYELWLWKRR